MQTYEKDFSINRGRQLNDDDEENLLVKTKKENKLNKLKREDELSEINHSIDLNRRKIILKIFETINKTIIPFSAYALLLIGFIYIIYILVIYFIKTPFDKQIENFFSLSGIIISFIVGVIANELKNNKYKS